ncbi:MAG: hypothetical protein PHS02_04520 [Candidatus ainarchaeum sp.]|nr:hypothetical protein [Candidatus ainarchaeum sp.]
MDGDSQGFAFKSKEQEKKLGYTQKIIPVRTSTATSSLLGPIVSDALRNTSEVLFRGEYAGNTPAGASVYEYIRSKAGSPEMLGPQLHGRFSETVRYVMSSIPEKRA